MSNSLTLDPERFAAYFRALSNPHRLRLFLRLAACLPEEATCAERDMRRCVGVIGRDLGVTPPTVSHHLKELRQAGLVHMERRGQNIECWVEPITLRELAEFFEVPKCC
jgi:ArsR family transcriptional regulator